jgi:hypothetical protein
MRNQCFFRERVATIRIQKPSFIPSGENVSAEIKGPFQLSKGCQINNAATKMA